MRRCIALTWLAFAVLMTGVASADVSLRPVGTFTAPVAVVAPPGDRTRVFVVERAGTVRLVKNGVVATTPFLQLGVPTDGERGLLSIAFAPDYASSGLLYLYYTAPGTGAITIEERRRSGQDPDVADASYARTVLTIPHGRFANHNGGDLQFGPDGMLYIGTGDGGGGGDPFANGQRLSGDPASDGANPLLGKLLRIDPRGGPPYAIPAGNPFTAPNAPQIWAYGLRNPWRFSFDRLTGDLVIGDVGEGVYEEIDVAPAAAGRGAGVNFGWPRFEGSHTYPAGAQAAGEAGFTFPAIEHSHSSGWCAITGGYVVRDPGVPELAGQYVYGDLCAGRLFAAVLGGAPHDLGLAVPSIVGFGEDGCQRVYVVSLDGAVQRLAGAAGGACVAPAPSAGHVPSSGTGGAGGTRGPRLSLRAAHRQRVIHNGFVRVRVSCDERCTVRATGRILVRRRGRARSAAVRTPLRTRTVRRTLRAGRRTALRLRVSRRARTRILRSLKRRGRRAYVRVATTAVDAAGNRTDRTVRVRIVRRKR